MKWLGENPFHTLLVLTARPGTWPAWQVAPIPLALAAGAGLAWAGATGDLAWGCAVGAGLLLFALADWALLFTLPRRGLSFGPIQPPFLALVLARWLAAVAAAPFAARWSMPTMTALALVQALLWALMAYGTLVEPFRVQITHLAISNVKLSNPGTPLRIVQLADLHVERMTPRERASSTFRCSSFKSVPGKGISPGRLPRSERSRSRRAPTTMNVSLPAGLGFGPFGVLEKM